MVRWSREGPTKRFMLLQMAAVAVLEAGLISSRTKSEPERRGAALALRSKGLGIRRVAREVGLGVGTVIRLIGNEVETRPA